MKKYIIAAVYTLISCYLAFAQVVVFIFNPVFSLEERNIGLEVLMYAIHGFIFVAFVYGVFVFAKKLWKQ